MEHPKDIGDRTTLAVMLALREVGFAVLVPFGENTRYDARQYEIGRVGIHASGSFRELGRVDEVGG